MQCLLSFLCEQQLLHDCKNISPTAIYTGVRCIALKICSRTALSELMSKFNVPLDTIIGQLQRRALCQSFNVWPNAHLQGTNGHEPIIAFILCVLLNSGSVTWSCTVGPEVKPCTDKWLYSVF